MFKVKHNILRIGFSALACCTGHSMQGQSLAASSQQAKIVASVETMFQALGTNNKGLFESRIAPGFYVYDAGMRFQGARIFQVVSGEVTLHVKVVPAVLNC